MNQPALLEKGLDGLIAAQAAIVLRADERVDTEGRFLKFAALIALLSFRADIHGRREILLEARAFGADTSVAQRTSSSVPTGLTGPIEVRKEITAILASEPTIALRARAIARQYVEVGMAAARSARVEVTKALGRGVRRMTQRGERRITVKDLVHEMSAWADQYAGVVFQTSVFTAMNAGKFSQANSAEVQIVASAFELVVVDDDVTRRGRPVIDRGEHHLAAQGLVAAFSDPVWRHAGPPNGYNCRETLRLVSKRELKKRGLLTKDGVVRRSVPATFAQFAPHPRFSGMRPDQRIYGTMEF